MVGQRNDSDLEMDFYESFFFGKGIDPYPVQEEAFSQVFKGNDLLVTVPTGTGKTMIAKAALFRALAQKKRVIFTSPLRALTEEKFREFCEDFGEENVGFATGDFSVNPDALVQVWVAEILWNRVYSEKRTSPADVVVMDEAHYFNDPGRGYVWEQTLIGLNPKTQIVLLSATIGRPELFCDWISMVRGNKINLVESSVRKVPIEHEYEEKYVIEVVKELAHQEEVPAVVFVFGRQKCFELARLLKSCRRFTSDEERAEIRQRCEEELLKGGLSKDFQSYLEHGIGVHHAGVLPRYKQLVEELTTKKLIRFVICTETIAAGINLPAKRVIFPSIIKYIKGKDRLLTPAEFHQMAGRAGRPQFDDKGVATVLAPESVVQDFRKEIKDAEKRGRSYDEAKIKKAAYSRAASEARAKDRTAYDLESHAQLVSGEPAECRSQTRLSAGQILAIGLPNKANDGDVEADTEVSKHSPPYLNLNIKTVIQNLLTTERSKDKALSTLNSITENLQALGVVDDEGKEIAGQMIKDMQGLDGPFVWWLLQKHDLDKEHAVLLLEFLVDHSVISKIFEKKQLQKKRDWIGARLREKRRDNPQLTWEDVEEEYDEKFPRELSQIEMWFDDFSKTVPHPELHGGKRQKFIWSSMNEESQSFMEYVDCHNLAKEEGNLFSYLGRVLKAARTIFSVTDLSVFKSVVLDINEVLVEVDPRVSSGL